MERKLLQIITVPKGTHIKLSFYEDEDDQPEGSYSIEKVADIDNGNITFKIPFDVTKVIVAMCYDGMDYAMVGFKLKSFVERIFFDEWVKNHKINLKFLDEHNPQHYPRKCNHCDTQLENVHDYELHQCPPQEK